MTLPRQGPFCFFTLDLLRMARGIPTAADRPGERRASHNIHDHDRHPLQKRHGHAVLKQRARQTGGHAHDRFLNADVARDDGYHGSNPAYAVIKQRLIYRDRHPDGPEAGHVQGELNGIVHDQTGQQTPQQPPVF